VKMKKLFYIATIVNILLWGVWLWVPYHQKRGSLQTSSIPPSTTALFNISKWQQATTRLSNKRLRRKFDFILNMQETIVKRRLD
jgi:hypothetical protein